MTGAFQAAGLMLALLFAVGSCSETARRDVPFLGPMRMDDPQVALGETIFMRECNQCHPRGESGIGVALNDKPLPDLLIRAQVRAGLGAMPAFSQAEISGEELDAIIAYLDYLRERGPFDDVL